MSTLPIAPQFPSPHTAFAYCDPPAGGLPRPCCLLMYPPCCGLPTALSVLGWKCQGGCGEYTVFQDEQGAYTVQRQTHKKKRSKRQD